MFMRIFILSLPDARERRLSALSKIRATGLPFEIVDGVEASKIRQECLASDEGASTWMKPGEVGCYMGHLRILQRIVDYCLPYACVLEDDFCLEPEPDFGLCELESNLPDHFHYIHLQRDLGLNPQHSVVGTERHYWRIAQTPLCSTGYVIERSLANFVLAHHAVCTMPIDPEPRDLHQHGRIVAAVAIVIASQAHIMDFSVGKQLAAMAPRAPRLFAHEYLPAALGRFG